MRLLFLHHQQRRPYQEEPGYNELFLPFIRARQVTAWSEFVYQTPLRQLLIDELQRRGRTPTGDPTSFIAAHFDADLYEKANVALLPALLQAVDKARPDLIIVNTQTYLELPQIKGRVREVLSCGGFPRTGQCRISRVPRSLRRGVFFRYPGPDREDRALPGAR